MRIFFSYFITVVKQRLVTFNFSYHHSKISVDRKFCQTQNKKKKRTNMKRLGVKRFWWNIHATWKGTITLQNRGNIQMYANFHIVISNHTKCSPSCTVWDAKLWNGRADRTKALCPTRRRKERSGHCFMSRFVFLFFTNFRGYSL